MLKQQIFDIRFSILDDILTGLYTQIIEHPVSRIEHREEGGGNPNPNLIDEIATIYHGCETLSMQKMTGLNGSLQVAKAE